MTQPGYQAGSEPMWWWQVAKHLDEAQRALANAMAHNVDDPRPIHALHGRLREGQAILLEIFRAKGLLPAAPVPNGSHAAPVPDGSVTVPAAIPAHAIPMAVVADVPVPAVPRAVVADVPSPLSAVEPAVSEEDQKAVAEAEAAPASLDTASVIPAPIPGAPVEAAPAAPGSGGVGG